MRVQWMTAKLSLGNASIEAGELAEQRGEYLEAASAFETALQDPDPLVVATAHNCLGKLAWHQGAYDASFDAFEKARAIAIRHDSLDARARAEIGLGNVYYARGDYARARELYDGVRIIASSAGVRGKVLLNLGIIANIEGDIAGAERHYRLACGAFADAGDTHGQAQAYHNLGMLHADRVEWDEADAAYGEALRLSGETGNREMIGLVTMNRSELSCAMGRYEQAVQRCDAALAIFAEIGAEVLRGTTLRWKGRALRELGQYQASERALTEAMRIAHRAQAKLLEAEAMQEMGATLTLAGDHGAARKWLKRALDVFVSLGAAREADEATADLKALTDKS
jgi:tetratricopeptide (TPR) repeat protein